MSQVRLTERYSWHQHGQGATPSTQWGAQAHWSAHSHEGSSRVHGCHFTSTGDCPGPGPCPRASRPRPPGATPSLGDTHHAGRLRHSHLRFSPGTSPGSGCRILHHVQGEDTWFGDGILKLGLPGIEVRDTSIHSKACSNGPGPHHAPLHHGSGISLRILPKVMVRNPAFSSKRCRPPYRQSISQSTNPPNPVA